VFAEPWLEGYQCIERRRRSLRQMGTTPGLRSDWPGRGAGRARLDLGPTSARLKKHQSRGPVPCTPGPLGRRHLPRPSLQRSSSARIGSVTPIGFARRGAGRGSCQRPGAHLACISTCRAMAEPLSAATDGDQRGSAASRVVPRPWCAGRRDPGKLDRDTCQTSFCRLFCLTVPRVSSSDSCLGLREGSTCFSIGHRRILAETLYGDIGKNPSRRP
jgi:hypothetical protein